MLLLFYNYYYFCIISKNFNDNNYDQHKKTRS